MTTESASALDVRWDLSALYASLEDPRLDAGIQSLCARCKDFSASYRGRLADALDGALAAYAGIRMLEDSVMAYLYLRQSVSVADPAVKRKIAETERVIADAAGAHLSFFLIELTALDDAVLEGWYSRDPGVARLRPWIDYARVFRPHLLSEPVEAALTKRAPFGPPAWSEFFDELEADITGEIRGERKTLTELLHQLSESHDAGERAEVLKVVDGCLQGTFAKYAAQTLYVVAGAAYVENSERGYPHPMAARNRSNRVSDAIVDALHSAVVDTAGPLARRYYRLKAALLGQKTLKWSDRNAPLPFADTTVIPFDEAQATVLASFESFSPSMAALARRFFDEKRIDAPAARGKRSGAFNLSVVAPGPAPLSYVLVNYLGSNRDVMTLAHELGHGVHGLLAGEAQGPLMFQAPIAYAETASVFAEMAAFTFLRERLATRGDDASLLALLMGKIDDIINTSVRQISFSQFERRLHGYNIASGAWRPPRKYAVEELNALWLDVTRHLYGADGEVFTYEHANHLWSYVSHFHHPFYVYGYAFGELLTQGLFALRPQMNERFEPLYLDLLRSGSSRDVTALLAPFGIDPAADTFWHAGIENGLGALVAEAEALSRRTGLIS